MDSQDAGADDGTQLPRFFKFPGVRFNTDRRGAGSNHPLSPPGVWFVVKSSRIYLVMSGGMYRNVHWFGGVEEKELIKPIIIGWEKKP